MNTLNPLYLELFNFLFKGGMLGIGALVGFSIHRWVNSKKHPLLQLILTWMLVLLCLNVGLIATEWGKSQHWAQTMIEMTVATFGFINLAFILIYTLGFGIGWQLEKYYKKLNNKVSTVSKK